MADVQITFGANIEALKKGVDGVRDSIDGLKESAAKLAEAFGIAFTLEGVKSFVESMAKLGETTQSVGARLGVSNSQVVAFSGLAAKAGTDIVSFSAEIERASANVQKSTRDSINPAAQALHVLGLSASQLVGQPTDQWFLRIADAVSKFNPSLNLTNAVTVAFGRQIANLIPIMLEGREKLTEFLGEWKKASEGVAAAAPGMDNTHEKLLLLGQSLTSLGARIFATLKPAIDAAIEGFTHWVQSIDTKTIISAVKSIAEATISVIQTVGAFVIAVSGYIDSFVDKLDRFTASKEKVFGTSEGYGNYLDGKFNEFGEPIEGAYSSADKAAEAGNERLQKRKEQLEQFVASFKAVMDRLTNSLGTSAPAAPGEGKQNAGAINVGLGQQAAAAMQAAQGQIKAADLVYQNEAEKIKSRLALQQITEDQKTALTIAAINKREDAELAAIATAEKAQGLSAQQQQRLEDEKTQIIQKAINQRQQIQDQGLQADTVAWQNALKPIENAWNSQLRSLLAGTETFGQAMKKIFADLVMAIIEKLETLAVQKLAVNLAGLFGDPATLAASAAKSIQTSMGQMYAGEAAYFAPFLGPGAPAAAAGVVATTQATALGLTGIGAFDVGGRVMSSGLGIIHEGETIVPANVDTPYSGAGGAGDVHFHFEGGVIGSQAWVNQMMPQLTRAMQSYQRLNPSTR